MRKVTAQVAEQPATMEKLQQIQEQMRDMCEPHYHEFYKVTMERGFVKITIPKGKH